MGARYTLFFNDIDKKKLPLVGGKGANLGEMTKAGFPVPYGFCVTTEAYKEFISFSGLSAFIEETVKDANQENISRIGAKIRERIKQWEIPETVAKEIISAVKTSGPDYYYAVRSSATAEDLAFASFAGQQDTYLNIKGETSLLSSVRDCWASLFTDRAILYRLQNKIEHERVHMSVVVQRMALPEISGIMFTADPVSGHRGIISIDAGYGLGEALVSGLVSPDIYKFRKSTLRIEGKTIAEKKLAILPVEGGGTKKVEIAGEKATTQVMDDSQIKSLAELGMKIEKHYGCPQDIEWCLENGRIYIVQSRAITSLFPLPSPMPYDGALHAYISLNHLQSMTDPVSPLGQDIFRNLITPDKESRICSRYSFIPSAGGRMYADITPVLRLKGIRGKIIPVLMNMDALLAQALGDFIQRSDFDKEIKGEKPKIRKLLLPMGRILLRIINSLVFKNIDGAVERVNQFIRQCEKEARITVEGLKPGAERIRAICNEGFFLGKVADGIVPYLIPGILSFKLLQKLEQDYLGSSIYVNEIVKGLEGNVTTEMGLLIGDLADMIRDSQALLTEFENQNYATLISRINGINGNDEFKQKFNDFISMYGVRAVAEIDIANDRWIENPEPLVKSILSIVQTSTAGKHREEYRHYVEKAQVTAEAFIKEVRQKRGKIKAKIVKRLVHVLRNTLSIREHHKFFIMRLFMIFKKALLEEAQTLVKKGQLVNEKDIFYIGISELIKAIENNESLLELVEARKEEFEHYKKLTPPRLMTSEGEEITAGYNKKDLPEGAMAGIGVSSGVIEGIAKVITDPSKESLNKGEILVAPFTDPGWTPLFINAAGLIMEVGGLLTHGTVVAREYGIPAVVGIPGATKKIKTGQKIRVDGNAGFVSIIEE